MRLLLSREIPTHRFHCKYRISRSTLIFHPFLYIFNSEINLIQRRPYLFSIGSVQVPVIIIVDNEVAYVAESCIEWAFTVILLDSRLNKGFIIFDKICQLLKIIEPISEGKGGSRIETFVNSVVKLPDLVVSSYKR